MAPTFCGERLHLHICTCPYNMFLQNSWYIHTTRMGFYYALLAVIIWIRDAKQTSISVIGRKVYLYKLGCLPTPPIHLELLHTLAQVISS